MNTTINLDDLLKDDNKGKQPQEQEEAPAVKINWNEVFTEWCYKIPKGYPTIVDGVFTEYEEVKILNVILEEKFGESIPLPEAPTKATKQKETKFEKWYSTKNSTWITPFLETIPIVESMVSKPVTLEKVIKTVQSNSNLDWKPEAVQAINELAPLLKDKASVDFVNNVYFKGETKGSPIQQSGPNLKSLNEGKAITSFIHGGVNKFYNIVNKATPGEKNKVFTADVILFWGKAAKDPLDAKTQEAIQKAIANPKIKPGTSLIDLGNGNYMACVSLKANVGRIGKLTAFTSRYVDTDDDSIAERQGLAEGLFDNLLTKFKGSGFGQLLVRAYEKLKTLMSDLLDTIKTTISPSNQDVVEYEKINATQDELDTMINQAEVITEADDVDKVLCTTCMQEKIKTLKPYIDRSLSGKALQDFQTAIKSYADGTYFKTKFVDFNAVSDKIKTVLQGKKLLQDTTNLILKAKPTKLKEAGGSCAPLEVGGKPLYVSRQQLKNILFANGNSTSFDLMTLLLKDSFKGVKPENLKQKKEALLKLATTLATESVFGRSGKLPLVKYTGTHLYQLGTKQEYAKKQASTLNSVFGGTKVNNLNLPIVALKVSPSKGKTGDSPYYYNVTLYTLYTIEPPEAGSIEAEHIKYAVIAFKCNSGSKFAFAVEGDKELGGDSLAKDLAKVD